MGGTFFLDVFKEMFGINDVPVFCVGNMVSGYRLQLFHNFLKYHLVVSEVFDAVCMFGEAKKTCGER